MVEGIFIETLMIFLITYALMDILCRLVKILLRHNEPENPCRKLIIRCDTEENIENIVRSSINMAQSAKCEILLAIKKETHESHIIIERLQSEFPYLKFIQLSDIMSSEIFGELSPENT